MPELLGQCGKDTEVARSNVAQIPNVAEILKLLEVMAGKMPELLEQRGRDTKVGRSNVTKM
ncbi:hypothetical protein V8E54_006126 [Elaphomyces granulatus]